MNSVELIRPAVALGLLTFIVWVYMYVLRISHMQKHRIDPERLKLAGAEADELLRDVDGPSDNLVNLFEIPVLFYFAVFAIAELGATDATFVRLAWAFVVFRALHSLVHCTYNRVMHRFFAYVLSTLVLIVIWIRIAVVVFAT